MKKKKLQCSVPTLLLAGVLCLTLAACGAKQSSDMLASDTDSAASAALPVKTMNAKRVDENPYAKIVTTAAIKPIFEFR